MTILVSAGYVKYPLTPDCHLYMARGGKIIRLGYNVRLNYIPNATRQTRDCAPGGTNISSPSDLAKPKQWFERRASMALPLDSLHTRAGGADVRGQSARSIPMRSPVGTRHDPTHAGVGRCVPHGDPSTAVSDAGGPDPSSPAQSQAMARAAGPRWPCRSSRYIPGQVGRT